MAPEPAMLFFFVPRPSMRLFTSHVPAHSTLGCGWPVVSAHRWKHNNLQGTAGSTAHCRAASIFTTLYLDEPCLAVCAVQALRNFRLLVGGGWSGRVLPRHAIRTSEEPTFEASLPSCPPPPRSCLRTLAGRNLQRPDTAPSHTLTALPEPATLQGLV